MVRTFKTSDSVTLMMALGLALTPLSALAQQLDTEALDPNAPTEPTPIEELAPTDQPEGIPGTEPLYDQGIVVTQIEVAGNKLVPAETILNALATKPGSVYSKRRLQNDLKRIYDLGYFTERLRVVPIASRNGVQLRIEVEENPTVNDVAFEGVTVIPEDTLKQVFAQQIGMPQNVNLINKGIQEVEQTYKDKGFILARVENITEDTPGTVKLVVNEGRVDKITFSGNRKTKDYVLRRAMAQKTGEVYNENTVTEDLRRVYSTQAFSDVRRSVKASPENPNSYELVVEVDEKKTGAISLGGGIDTGTGVFGSVGYSDPNFMGRGQNFSSVFSIGSGVLGSDRDTIRQRVLQFQTTWFNPSVAETNNSLGASIFARDLASFNVPLAIERRLGSEVTWGRPLESIPGTSVSLGVGFEDVNVREGVSLFQLSQFGITPAQRQAQLQDGTFAFLNPAIAFDSRDNRFNPTSGWLNSASSHLALGIGNDSYGTVLANIRRYLKVTNNVTFAMNVQAGGNAFGDIPLFNMFRLGGAYTIRGFQEGGVGVGNNYVLGSAEIRSKVPFLKAIKKFPLYDLVQLATFVDAGILLDEDPSNNNFNRPGYGISVGAGLRASVPALGPIRIDWAEPLGNRGNNIRRLNFGVGQKF